MDRKTNIEKSETAKTASHSSVVFTSSKINFGMQNQSKRTLIELKFCIHLDKCISKVSTKFELKHIYNAITDQKTRTDLVFSWGFAFLIKMDLDQSTTKNYANQRILVI
jgi:hypothetical protein